MKPTIIPAGREEHKAGIKGRMERGGGVLAQGADRHSRLDRVISHDGEDKRKICVELGYGV